MKTVKVDFKFGIGDTITSVLKQGIGRAYLVVERVYRECKGGGQNIYVVRNFTAMANDTYLNVNEIEMEIYVEKEGDNV